LNWLEREATKWQSAPHADGRVVPSKEKMGANEIAPLSFCFLEEAVQ